jgi:hypothetical protein
MRTSHGEHNTHVWLVKVKKDGQAGTFRTGPAVLILLRLRRQDLGRPAGGLAVDGQQGAADRFHVGFTGRIDRGDGKNQNTADILASTR